MIKSHRYCVAFSGLIRDQMHELAPFRTENDFDRNEVVYYAGDPPDSLFQVTRGRIKVIRISNIGKEKTIDIYQAGDFFGELCICGGGKRTDQAIALEPVQVTAIQIKGLLQLLPRKPELMLDLLQLVCGRLSEYQDQIATLAFDNVPVRLAREILRLSQAPDCRAENGGSGAIRLGLNLTHEEIASLIGTSREIVTTLMNQFRQKGLVDYNRRAICVYPEAVEGYLKSLKS
jgi:CRP/FNR family transcriptional regulator